jgi:small-conductance mechanosensitive channel
MTYLETIFYHNSLLAWSVAGGVALVVFAGLYLLKGLVVRQITAISRRTETKFDNIVAAALNRTKGWFIVLLAVRAGMLFLEFPPRVWMVLALVTIIGVLLQVAIWINAGIQAWLDVYTEQNLEDDAASVTTMQAVAFLARVLVWAVVLLMALDNLGVDITALIAGLGIGGIAIALALQNVLGDLFSSLSIVIDKPFVVGDFIIVGDELGTVEKIGLKTTRVRSLSGEQLVFSNSDLLSSRIRNFKRMGERRVVFGFGVTYQTPREKLRRIPQIVKELIDAEELARFDRAHFKEFGDFSLNFEVVFHVLRPDFNTYMDIQQSVNLGISEALEEMGVEFAYPTQTLYVARDRGAEAALAGGNGAAL